MRRSAFGFFLATVGAGLIACGTSSFVEHDGGVVDAAVVNDADQIPCEPRLVLQTICQQCHSRPMRNGAPFPLVNRSDILATRSKSAIRELMIEQLDARRMPLQPVTMEDDQRAVLLSWLRAGAPAVPRQTCPDAGADVIEAGADSAGDDSGSQDAGSDAPTDAPPE